METKSYLAGIRAQMIETARAHGLPDLAHLKMDFLSLERFRGSCFVWLLHSRGTVLFPVCVGVDPTPLVEWLQSSACKHLTCWLVDTSEYARRPLRGITRDEAVLLASHPPIIRRGVDIRAYAWSVNSVLERGYSLGIWGGNTPGGCTPIGRWCDWDRFFDQVNNPVMKAFIANAIETVANSDLFDSLQ